MDGGRIGGVGRPVYVLTGELLSTVYGHPVTAVAHPRRDCPLVPAGATAAPGAAAGNATSDDG